MQQLLQGQPQLIMGRFRGTCHTIMERKLQSLVEANYHAQVLGREEYCQLKRCFVAMTGCSDGGSGIGDGIGSGRSSASEGGGAGMTVGGAVELHDFLQVLTATPQDNPQQHRHFWGLYQLSGCIAQHAYEHVQARARQSVLQGAGQSHGLWAIACCSRKC